MGVSGGNWKPVEGCGSQQLQASGSSRPPEQSGEQRNHEERQEDEEKYLRDTSGCAGNAAKAERASYDGDNKEDESPVQHVQTP